MVTAASVQGAAEALALVYKSGLSVEKFAAAMRNNGSNSATLDMKLPMMMQGNFEPHFSVKHMLKDVVIATRLARGGSNAAGVAPRPVRYRRPRDRPNTAKKRYAAPTMAPSR